MGNFSRILFELISWALRLCFRRFATMLRFLPDDRPCAEHRFVNVLAKGVERLQVLSVVHSERKYARFSQFAFSRTSLKPIRPKP
jgi:hypothetical protein